MGETSPATAGVDVYLPLVGAIAKAVSRRLPNVVEFNDLISDGVIGLMEALRKYDPSRGVAFSAYAGHRIRGAMIDGLRRRDPLPRTLRRAQKFGWPARAHAAETRAAGYLVRSDSRGRNREAGIQFLELDEALTVPADEADGPEALAVEADLRRQVWRGLEALPPRDREVLVLRFIDQLPLREVAARLSLSITRIVEIQTRGLVRLRRFFAGEPILRCHPRARTWQEHAPGSPNRSATFASALSIRPQLLRAE